MSVFGKSSSASNTFAPETRPGHVRVGTLTVLDGNLHDAVELCLGAVRSRRGMRVATANLDFVARARRDPQLRRDLETSNLVVADGAPVAWLARMAGGTEVRRAAGVDLILSLCGRATDVGGLRLALYGSSKPIAAAAADRLDTLYPGVTVATVLCPPFRSLTPDEEVADALELGGARPDVVLVALGCPRQERFIAEHHQYAPHAVWIGVGGSFDFLSGTRVRAPKMFRTAGAEWLVRLAQEPRRLWRRYLVDDLPVLLMMCLVALRERARSPVSSDGAATPVLGPSPEIAGAEFESTLGCSSQAEQPGHLPPLNETSTSRGHRRQRPGDPLKQDQHKRRIRE